MGFETSVRGVECAHAFAEATSLDWLLSLCNASFEFRNQRTIFDDIIERENAAILYIITALIAITLEKCFDFFAAAF